MKPAPLYEPKSDGGAYQLRYAWTGWPSGGTFAEPPEILVEQTRPYWERDGLRVLEYRWTESAIQIVFSATPDGSPEFIAARAKGRLDHAIRRAGLKMQFSRKVAIRAIGDNTRRDLEAYLARQVTKEEFADPRFTLEMAELTVIDQVVDLSAPAESARGRYWYNLHLVFVVAEHARIQDINTLRALRDSFIKVAAKKGHAIARLSVMPDHLHAMLRPRSGESPLEIVFAYQNNLAYMIRQNRTWSDGYYVGTFGEFTMQAVRNNADPRCKDRR